MRRLAEKLEEAAADSELRRYCERILRIRSTGWTQGIFANFAAESMVPKGPEWGGGNWEIKTPISMKDIPQWELAGEVMPYMKTDDGGIPAMVADHIGVFLGAIRGRGNVVEVSEKSLVKAFTATSGENKVSGTSDSVASLSKVGISADAKGDSIMNTLSRQLAGPPAVATDEQARAEEEFKKSLYGVVNESSSDDDEATSKSKKIHIRIRDKPVAAPTVDVDKIKEATKQFRLADSLGPSRTRSLSGNQDLSMMLAPPAPVTASAATATTTATMPPTTTDLFGTETFAQMPPQPGPMVAGMGVSAGPIPEDFFQNTIPSLQVAATLPAPGTYLSKIVDQSSQRMDGNKPAPNQDMMTKISLPDGGIPPQVPQQSAARIEAIGLPDGGIPPQSQAQALQMPHTHASQMPQGHSPQMSVASQPIDLSSLEGPGSRSASSATAPRPQSPPTAVRPGQVNISWVNTLEV